MYTNKKDCQFEMLVTNVAIHNMQRKLQKINVICPRPLPRILTRDLISPTGVRTMALLRIHVAPLFREDEKAMREVSRYLEDINDDDVEDEAELRPEMRRGAWSEKCALISLVHGSSVLTLQFFFALLRQNFAKSLVCEPLPSSR
jgi:hypothetical protein